MFKTLSGHLAYDHAKLDKIRIILSFFSLKLNTEAPVINYLRLRVFTPHETE